MAVLFNFEYNNKIVNIRKHFNSYVIDASELMKALNIENKSVRDMLRSGIPKEEIVVTPLNKRCRAYYLKRDGIVAFINKYRAEELDDFIKAYDDTVKTLKEQEEQEEQAEDKITKTPDIKDSYTVDLLEDILAKIEKQNQEAQRFYNAAMSMFTRQLIMFLEAESLYSKTAAILLRAESLGPIARINKELTRDMISLGKEVLSDATACDEALKEYDEFDKDRESDQTDDNNNSETSGLLIRTDKKHKNNRKRC